MHMHASLSRRAAGLLAAVLATVVPTSAPAQQAEHAFIFVIDGLRASEGFGDPSHVNVGPLWDELAPQGSLLTYMEVRDQPETIPSHNTIVSGTYADVANLSPYEGRAAFGPRSPTLFEAYRLATGASADSCWAVGNTPLIHDTAHSLMPGYGPDYGASHALDYNGSTQDSYAWDQIDAIMADHEVGVMLTNLHEVDRHAHSGFWLGYTSKALEASETLVAFWNQLQADPVYQDNTVLVVATDHGRHLEGVFTGWRDHGCSCAGCRQVFMLVLGPGVREGFVSDEPVSTLDIAPTVAHMLGLDFPYHRGRILTEVLQAGASVDPGPGGAFNPALVGADGVLVRVSERQDPELMDDEGAHRVLVEISEDGGQSWDETLTSGGSALQYAPDVWTDGEVTVVAWLEIMARGEEWSTRVRRIGAESSDWEDVLFEAMEGSSTPVGNLSLTSDGDDLYLMELNARHETLRMWVSDDRGLSWSEEQVGYEIDRYFPRDVDIARSGDNLVAVYSSHAEGPPNMEDHNDNTEIYWMVSADGGDSWIGGEHRLTDDDAPSITPVIEATPDGALHTLWADRADGTFQLFHAESTDDGESFSDPVQLTFDSEGSWEPAAVADGERLYVAWSQFDARDEATIHLAALEGGALVEERVLGNRAVARTPFIAPLGDCTSMITWTESDLDGAWELVSEQVVTAGTPATSGTATLDPAEVDAGHPAAALRLDIQIELGEDDRGVDGIEVHVPSQLTPAGTATLEVDGDLVEGVATYETGVLRFDAAEIVDVDGALLTLRFEAAVQADPFEDVPFTATLHHGLESCATEVDGALLLDGVAASGDDDDDDGDDDDDSAGDDDGCECSSGGRPGTAPATLAILLGLTLFIRRRTSSERGE